VHLLKGEIVGCSCTQDNLRYARLLRIRGHLDALQAAALPEAGFGALFAAVPEAAALRVLSERFHENLACVVVSPLEPSFEELPTVFLDNMQFEHDPDELLDACCAMADDAGRQHPSTKLTQGPKKKAHDPLQQSLLELIGKTGITVGELLARAPLEETSARGLLLDMIESNLVKATVPSEHERGYSEAPTMPAFDIPEQPKESIGAGNLSSLADWLDGASGVDDEDLQFFEDHDYTRGGGQDGAFSTASRNLDRVDVAKPVPVPDSSPVTLANKTFESPADDEPDMMATMDAPSRRFGPPTLSEDEALAKIKVANDVLRTVVAALDTAEGSGRGQAMMQLLVDGSPRRFVDVLKSLKIEADGALPNSQLLAHLNGRPAAEHRPLLNQSLVDLIDRALSSAADELPDETFDEVLEGIAGYRQRLGR
jgi:hypothetical protein